MRRPWPILYRRSWTTANLWVLLAKMALMVLLVKTEKMGLQAKRAIREPLAPKENLAQRAIRALPVLKA